MEGHVIRLKPEQLFSVARAHLPRIGEGDQIHFASDLAGLTQTYRLDGPGRFPIRLAPSQERTLPLGATPSGLLVRQDRGGDETWQLGLIDAQGLLRRITQDSRAVHRGARLSPDRRRVGLAYNPGGQADWVLAVLDLASGEIEHRLDIGGYWSWLGWGEDGRDALVAKLGSPVRGSAYMLSGDGTLRPLLSRSRQVPAAMWSGGRLLATAELERDFVGLLEVDLNDPERAGRRLVDEGHDVLGFVPSPDGRLVAVVVNEGAYDSLRVLRLSTGREEWRSGLPAGVVFSDNSTDPSDHLCWSGDGERLLVSWESPTAPAEIYELPSGTRWTYAGGDPIPGLVRPAEVTYRSFDELQVPALHYRVDGTPRATVVLFHGGPEGQSRAYFDTIAGMWVLAGFDVLAPNVRGSTGYGARYDSLDDRELRWDSVRDGCEAARWLRQTGQARQLVAMGGSYGGFMTLAVLVENPALWDAGVEMVGIADWLTFLGNTSGWRRAVRVSEYGEPDGPDAEFLGQFSPLRRAGEIRARLLIIHGRNDVRVPVSEAVQIHEAVPGSELLIFEDEGHGITRHGNRVRAYGRALAFVRERLGLAGT